MDLIDQQDAAARVHAKLVLGVHQQQPAPRRLALPVLKERQRGRARLARRCTQL